MLLKEAKDYLNSKNFILEDNQELNEGILTIAGGVALGLIALKVVGKVLGVGLKGLASVLTQSNHLAILKVIDRDKDIIASELKEYMMSDAEVSELIENKSITVKQIQEWIENSSNKLIQPEYKANGLKMANNELHDRQLKSRGLAGGVSGGIKGHFDNHEKIREISSKLAQVVYDTIYEVKNESIEGAYKDMNLKEAKEILNKNGYIVEKMEWGSDPKFYSTKTPVEDVGDFSDDDQEVSPVAVEKIKELAERLADEGFKVRTGISWAGPFVSIKKTKIGPVAIVYEDDNDCFTVELDDGGQVNLSSDYEEDMPDFVGFLNGENNF